MAGEGPSSGAARDVGVAGDGAWGGVVVGFVLRFCGTGGTLSLSDADDDDDG